MNERMLRLELQNVSRRYRRLLLRWGLAACWLSLALAGLGLLAWTRDGGLTVPGTILVVLVALPAVLVPMMLAALRAARDPLWVARRIEQRYPDLDPRHHAPHQQQPARAGPHRSATPAMGFLQDTVVAEALAHGRRRPWVDVVPVGRMRAQVANFGMLAFLAAVVVTLAWRSARAAERRRLARRARRAGIGGAFEVKVEPADTSVERGSSLLVLARFGRQVPGAAELLARSADGQVRPVRMSKSLNDPVFAGRVPAADRDFTYAVRYGDAQTRWYKASVFDYPDLKQADARG